MRGFLLIVFLSLSLEGQSQPTNIEGAWKGILVFNEREMDIHVSFQHSDSTWSGHLSSQVQNLKELILSNIVLEQGQLKFNVPMAGGSWEGSYDAESNSLTGEWIQGPYRLPLLFERTNETLVIHVTDRAQTPKPPFPYEVREVSIRNHAQNIQLGGTLSLPHGPGPFPAAILLTVAGANDRDQTHGNPPHKPYFVLADHLTRQGIAVLRMDDRGVGASTGDIFDSTIEDFASDALAAVDYLLEEARIDSNGIGFIGNSEGSLVGPLAASQFSQTAFVITLGGIATKGSEVILNQIESLGAISGIESNVRKRMVQNTQGLFDVLKTNKDHPDIESLVKNYLLEVTDPEATAGFYLVPSSIEEQAKLFSSPWYVYQVNYDPGPVLEGLNCPLLAINGQYDPFVDPDKNLEAFGHHLREGRNVEYSLVKMSDLNHVCQDADTGHPTAYSTNEVSFSPRVLDLISTWLRSSLSIYSEAAVVKGKSD